MCGIAGVLSLTSEPADAALVAPMLAAMFSRGPDDAGLESIGRVALGMRRLSILDPTPRGHQPMHSPDGRFTIVYNGEVYNFLELADELTAIGLDFRSTSDTEVLLAAYATWGPDCVRKLNGIFAFAIWDRLEGTLFLARDRFGVKPLFLAEHGGLLGFASEIKALRTLPWVTADPDMDVVGGYLLDGSVATGRRTFFTDIENFPPAHSLLVRGDGTRTWLRYWDAPELARDPGFKPRASDAELIEEFRALLIDAIALQLRSDVPIGSCLSGGLDSSSIVSVAAGLRSGRLAGTGHAARHEREGNPQLAFFAEFRETGIDERPYVDAVVAATGVDLRTVTPDTATFLESLPGILHAQDEPFGSTSIVAQYHVMRIAHEAGVKVLLDGQGADEMLGGYQRYAALRFAGGLRRPGSAVGAAGALAANRAAIRSTLGYTLLGPRRLPASLNRRRMPSEWLGGAVRGRRVSAPEPPARPGTPLATRLWYDLASDNLPELLRYEDRNSMAWSIEARVPFLDHRLAEAALRLPDRLKIASLSDRKIALKRAVDGIVPDAVLQRKDKIGFQSPEVRWLTEAMPAWRRLAANSRAEAAGLIGTAALTHALDAFLVGRATNAMLWRLLNVEMWLRAGAGEPPLD